MFCIELEKGVYFLVWFGLFSYALSVLMLGIVVQSVDWKARAPMINVLDIVQ